MGDAYEFAFIGIGLGRDKALAAVLARTNANPLGFLRATWGEIFFAV